MLLWRRFRPFFFLHQHFNQSVGDSCGQWCVCVCLPHRYRLSALFAKIHHVLPAPSISPSFSSHWWGKGRCAVFGRPWHFFTVWAVGVLLVLLLLLSSVALLSVSAARLLLPLRFSLSIHSVLKSHDSNLVDPASSHTLVSKIKPCMSKYKQLYTVKLRMAHYISYSLFDSILLLG